MPPVRRTSARLKAVVEAESTATPAPSPQRKAKPASSGTPKTSNVKSQSPQIVEIEPDAADQGERTYEVDEGIPISADIPDYSKLEDALDVTATNALAHSLEVSRRSWLTANLFEKYWTRPPRGRKLATGETHARDKMSKLCECRLELGPHLFDVKLFLVKDESGDEKEDPDQRMIEEQRARREAYLREQGVKTEDGVPAEKLEREGETEIKKEDASTPATTDGAATESQQTQIEVEPVAQPDSHPAESEKEATREVIEIDDAPETNAKENSPIGNGSKEETKDQETKDLSGEAGDPEPEPMEVETNEAGPKPGETEIETKEANETEPGSESASQPESQTAPTSVDPVNAQEEPTRQPDTETTASRPPATSGSAPEPISSPNNQLMILKLQAMARIDPGLNSLMRIVATGNASQDQVMTFQRYITKAREMDLTQLQSRASKAPQTPAGRRAPAQPRPLKPKTPRMPKEPKKTKGTYTTKKSLRDIMIVFEFRENPVDRYILPRDAIVEVQPSGDIVLSYLLIHNEAQSTKELPPEPEPPKVGTKRKNRRSKKEAEAAAVEKVKPQVFSAMTMIIHDIPRRSIGIIERSVTRKEIAFERIENVIKTGIRASFSYVWLQVEEDDQELIDALHEPVDQPGHIVSVKKREYKPRVKKLDADGNPIKRQKKEDTKAELRADGVQGQIEQPGDKSTQDQSESIDNSAGASGASGKDKLAPENSAAAPVPAPTEESVEKTEKSDGPDREEETKVVNGASETTFEAPSEDHEGSKLGHDKDAEASEV